MHDVPTEILEIVVEFASADKTTLQALSLVSTTCLALSRKHLFAVIALHPLQSNAYRISDPPCSSLLAIIEASKRRRSRLGSIAPFVRHLRIYRSRIAEDSSFAPVLHALSNLVSFWLSGLWHMPIFWAKIPVTARDAIIRYVLSQSTLVEVRLCSMVFENPKQVNSLLGYCRGLRTLEICHSGVQNEGEVEVGTDGEVENATLDTLTLGPFTPILFIRSLLHPSCPIKINLVRKLCLTVTGNFSDVARILLASTSLETLELVLTDPSDMKIEQLNLSKLPSLCNLRIKFDMIQAADIPLKWLAVVLRTGIDRLSPTCPNKMKNLTVVFPLFVRQLIDAMKFSEWRSVDAVLCGDGHKNVETRSHAYSNLKRVNVEFILKKSVGLELAPRLLDEFVLDSPGLKERGLLSVDAVDAYQHSDYNVKSDLNHDYRSWQ